MHQWNNLNRAIAVAFCMCIATFGAARVNAGAQAPLDPNAFTSLGSLGGGSSYAFDTGIYTIEGQLNPPSLRIDNGAPILGTVLNGVAVFDFSTINLAAGSSLTATGALPLALLSRGGATFNGNVDVSGHGVSSGPGGGNVSDPHVGRGPGAGPLPYYGGGFGGNGGDPAGEPFGGPTYGDPTHVFLGGSSGAGNGSNESFGGGGGGGLEISALSDIVIGGSLTGNGGAGTAAINLPTAGGGGGSGGGIFIASPGDVTASTLIEAIGGAGGPGAQGMGLGGYGGGGRVLIEASSFSGVPAFGGALVAGGGEGAGDGTFVVTGYVPPVPEPSFVVPIIGACVSMSVSRRRR